MSARRISFVAIGALCGGGAGCLLTLPGYAEYPSHCWESKLAFADIQETDGYFDSSCINYHGGTMDAPVQTTGYPAKACLIKYYPSLNATLHKNLKHAIAADIAQQTLSQDESDAYDDWVGGLTDGTLNALATGSALHTCIAQLTCNETYCDIDPSVPGDQACKKSSAEQLCTTYVADELEALLELPSPSQYPECSTHEIFETSEDLIIGPEMNATDEGTDDCLEDDDGFNPEDGADSTGAGADPFGDVTQLISCTGNDCSLDPDLILNLMENFRVFFDEGVTLHLVDSSVTCGPGIKLAGLNSGEAADDLADEFGVQNGDIIWKLDGSQLTSMSRVAAAMDKIAHEKEFEVITKRRNGSNCDTTTYDLTIE